MTTCASCGYPATSGTHTPAITCELCGNALSGSPLASAPDALPAGTLLKGGYRVGRALATGNNMVYLGCEPILRRLVVIKEAFSDGVRRDGTLLIMPVNGRDEKKFQEAREALIDEAQLQTRLQHQNIPHVFAHFEDNGTSYSVIQHRSGLSLRDIVESRGKLAEAEALQVFFDLANTVAAVHKQKCIHCDLTPNNVLYDDASKQLTLLDFGEARKVRTRYETGPLRFSTPRGTNGYAAPEQYDGRILGYACDIYSLGATLYFLLERSDPPPAPNRQQGKALPGLRSISAPVRSAIERAMALEVSDRHESIDALLKELRPPSAAPVRSAPTPSSTRPPRAASPPMPGWGQKKPPAWWPDNPYAVFGWKLAAWLSPRILDWTRKFWVWFLPRFIRLNRQIWAWLWPQILPRWRPLAGLLLVVLFARWSWEKATNSFTPAPTPAVQPSATATPAATVVPTSSAPDPIRSRTIPESSPPKAIKRTAQTGTPSNTNHGLEGTWRGIYAGRPASLALRIVRGSISGTLTVLDYKGFYRIALEAHRTPQNLISIRQTKVLSGPRGGEWFLGEEEGRLAMGKRAMELQGKGRNGHFLYDWSFVKSSSTPTSPQLEGGRSRPNGPRLAGTWGRTNSRVTRGHLAQSLIYERRRCRKTLVFRHHPPLS